MKKQPKPRCHYKKDTWKDKREWTTDYEYHDWVGREDEFGTFFQECVNCRIKLVKA